MKKTAKTLLGVLSVGALVGTGYAMWHVNGGFTSYTTDGVAPGIETIVDDKFGTLEVTAIDDKIRFDSNYNKETGEDLDVSYKVKAVANVIDGKPSDRDPYELSFYETISSEYLPNLKVTTVAMKGEQELEGTDPFFKYVNLPVFDTVSYKEWLSAEAKANEGYVVNLNFTWGDETEGINPDEYWRTLDPVTQKANFEDLTSALKDVTFKFVFEVGGDDSVVVDNKTDEITITTVEGSTLSIEGMSNGTVTEGTHQVTLDVTEENKVLKDSKVYVTYTDQEGVPGNDEIILEAQNGRTVYETYVGEYTFKANFKYELTYELVDDAPVTEMKTFYFKDVAAMNEWGSVGYVYAWNSVNNENNAEWPGVAVTQLSWNVFDDNANVYMGEIDVAKYDKFIFNTESSTGDPMGQTRDISISEVGDNNFVMLTTATEGKYDVAFADYESTIETKKATINLDFNEEGGKVSYEEKQYYNNDLVTLNIEPNEGYTIDNVLLGDTTIVPEEGVYKATVKTGENNFKVTFVKEAVDYSIGQITKTDQEYTVRGVITNISKNSFIIEDETGGILVYGQNSNWQKGDYVEVTGTPTIYNSILEFDKNAQVSLIQDDTGKPNLSAIDLTPEIVSGWTTILDSSEHIPTANVKTYKWRTTGGVYNGYSTVNLNGSDVVIEIYDKPSTINIIEGYDYDIVATFVSYNTSASYAQVMIESATLVESIPTEVSITEPENTTIKIGEKMELKYTIDKPYSSINPTWVTSNDKIALVDAFGVVTGVSSGVVDITITFGNISDTISITVSDEAVTSYSLDFLDGSLTLPDGYKLASSVYASKDSVYDYVKKYDSSNIINGVSFQAYGDNNPSGGIHSDTELMPGIKINKCILRFELTVPVNKIRIKAVCWNKDTTNYLDINGGEQINFESTDGQTLEDFEFDLTEASSTIDIHCNKRCAVMFVEFIE